MLETLQKTSPPDNGKMDSTGSQSAGNAVLWLAGFIDGEGSIGFDKQSTKITCYSPHLTITNCHEPTIERVANILSDLGVRYWVVSPKSRLHRGWKQDWIVVIRGLKRMKPLLELLIPHLFTKKRQAESVLEFIKERLSKSLNSPYGEKEMALVALLHELNKRGSSETTRTTRDTVKI